MNASKIIQQAMAKQPTGVEVAFKQSMKPFINKALEVKRTEVGDNIFKGVQSNSE